MTTWDKLPLWLWIALGILMLAQSTLLFLDAQRQGRRYWFWGLWGLIQFPLPSLVYLLTVRRAHRRREG
ncbi:sigmaY antisigma factor component [Paenibacillus athensensis]|uniref:SigmaY antisigma factor component n=1 Tax=Paenibacillus athensensis TaxID=1967502 RepID=A0A4Y8Q8K5_9BACL|nr:sigmaY antisigma factor component [Paenibacillus athensensis]MCD1260041.1 sigmaY antisigma factor component [Paenibacillus athensensis]